MTDGKSLKERIECSRPFIHWAELGGLLHDIGKLSQAFIAYRQNWWKDAKGYDKDPHDHEFLDNHDELTKRDGMFEHFKINWLERRLDSCIMQRLDIETPFAHPEDYDLKRFVHEHVEVTITKRKDPDGILAMLKAADGCDSAIDRNNPLFSADQVEVPKIYNADVFGNEVECLDPNRSTSLQKVDEKRRDLYQSLQDVLPAYFEDLTLGKEKDGWIKRKKILEDIETAFDSVAAFADTTRPNNDTSLWEHCYAVASIFKALLLHKIIHQEPLDNFKKVKFGLFAVGWDGLAFISKGQKIGDIVGLQETIESIKKEISKIVEHEFCLGNCIYQDQDGMCFLIPSPLEFNRLDECCKLFSELGKKPGKSIKVYRESLKNKNRISEWFQEFAELLTTVDKSLDEVKEDSNGLIGRAKENIQRCRNYSELLGNLIETISQRTVKRSAGDLQPKFSIVGETTFTTSIVKCLKALKEQIVFPIVQPTLKFNAELGNKWPQEITRNGICPICSRRPIEDQQRSLCNQCSDRRVTWYKSLKRQVLRERPQSRFVDSVVAEDILQQLIPTEEKILDTPFLANIVSANETDIRRTALIVAKFDLQEWLNGRMVRTLFVKEAHGLQAEFGDLLKSPLQFAEEVKATRDWLVAEGKNTYSYGLIKEQIDVLLNPEKQKDYACKIAYLYGKPTQFSKEKGQSVLNRDAEAVSKRCREWLKAAKDEVPADITDPYRFIHNLICAKTPTPSTMLDIWRTTEKFLQSLQEITKDKLGIKEGFAVEVEFLEADEELVRQIDAGAAYEGKLAQISIELVFMGDDKKMALILGWSKEQKELFDKAISKTKEVVIDGKQLKRQSDLRVVLKPAKTRTYTYSPTRLIIASPNMFMAIVPADKALIITQEIYKEYEKCFGKVMGRLPMSIGNIFFAEKTPMFAVLDAGRRMVRNFERLSESEETTSEPIKKYPPMSVSVWSEPRTNDLGALELDLEIKDGTGLPRRFTWKLAHKLGDKTKDDFYHPYFIIEPSNDKNYSERSQYFKTIAGDVAHFSEVEKDDVLQIYPNYYDFEFLDSTTRRYDIKLDSNLKRKSNITGHLSKPYLLEEFNAELVERWNKLKSSDMPLTDTQLRNMESLWLTKLQEWVVNNPEPDNAAIDAWQSLVKATLGQEFPKLSEAKKKDIMESVVSGRLFDCLELHLRILKDKIKDDQQHGGV